MIPRTFRLLAALLAATLTCGCGLFSHKSTDARNVMHPDADVRRETVQEIGKTHTPDAVTVLVERLLKDPDPLVRAQAAHALGQVKDPAAVPDLIEALKDTQAIVRWDACDSLTVLHDPACVDPVIAVLKNDDSVDVKRSAAHALSTFPDPKVVPPLIAATADPEPGVAKAAAKALLTLTGLSFGANRPAWEAWVKQGAPNSKLALGPPQ